MDVAPERARFRTGGPPARRILEANGRTDKQARIAAMQASPIAGRMAANTMIAVAVRIASGGVARPTPLLFILPTP